MSERASSNRRSTSTTWEYRKVKIRGAAREGHSTPKASRWSRLRRRDPRSPLTLTIRYRGGAEAWWFIEARGRSGAFPGHRCLHDVMTEVNRDYAPGDQG